MMQFVMITEKTIITTELSLLMYLIIPFSNLGASIFTQEMKTLFFKTLSYDTGIFSIHEYYRI